MEWIFNKKAFMEWIKEEVPAPMGNHFTYDLVSNVVDYVMSKTKFLGFHDFLRNLANLLPDTDYEELERFIEWR